MSVLRYPGGKSRAVKTLDKYVTRYGFDTSVVLSPFLGGASFELYLANKRGSRIFANDLFRPLYLFWHYVQTKPRRLVERIKMLLPIDVDDFRLMQKDLLGSISKMRCASYFYCLNRCSFSGTTTVGGFSSESSTGRLNSASISRLLRADLDNLTLSNLDFEEFLGLYPDPNTFIFLDPPYMIESRIYDINNFDHERLRRVLGTRRNWILCYNDCSAVRELYDGYTIKKAKWSYGMNKSKKSSEVIIINKSQIDPQNLLLP